jgi:hypothetical protein
MTQTPLIPFTCGFKGCDRDAICGLRHKTYGVVVNVCADHFERMKETSTPETAERRLPATGSSSELGHLKKEERSL